MRKRLGLLCLGLWAASACSSEKGEPRPVKPPRDAGTAASMHDGSPGPGPDGGDEAPFDGGMSSDAGANSRPDNDASAPPDGVRACTSDALGGCTRGMYVSLYTDHIGTLALDEDPAGNTEKFRYILGNTSKEDTLLA